VNDYPAAITAVSHVEPVPRRIRAILAGETVLDTIRTLYVWEWPYYPQYYIPVADVRRDLLILEGHTQQSRRGTSEAHTLQAGRPRVRRPGTPVPARAGAVGRLPGPDSGDLFARIGSHRCGSHESFEARSPAAVSVVVHDSAGGDS
jgi:Domain of unknown function (DUF427)